MVKCDIENLDIMVKTTEFGNKCQNSSNGPEGDLQRITKETTQKIKCYDEENTQTFRLSDLYF